MNFLTPFKGGLALTLICFSQIVSGQDITPCATDEVRRQIISANPEILQKEESFNRFAEEFSHSGNNQRSAPYIIPVVFHIIHDYGPENISDAQILDAVEKMNEDFSKNNADFLETVPEFQGIAADAQIEFRLAQRTLSGACTDGIERIPSLRTYEGSDAAKLEGWQPAFYLNIWVVKDLQNGAAAYAYYPTSISGFLIPADGIICRYDYVGSIGAAGSYSAHTLSHEIGHYLNLAHCWGSTNSPGISCGDDQVPDTPTTEGWVSCNLAGASCLNEIDNVQNFMEYSYCSTMFTEGQKSRMFATLNGEDANRDNLWTPENLALTGTEDGYVAGLCDPVADFYATSRFVCADETVYYHDVSWGGDVESRSWEFEGGTPSSSTEINPEVTYTEPGWHKVTLTVNNASGSRTSAIDEYVYISPSTAILDETYYGNFNDETEALTNWVFYNKYPDSHEWQWKGTNGYWAGGCAWLNSRFVPDDETDVLISPAFDLSSGFTNNVFFKYSTTTYAFNDSQYDMVLKLYYSNTCGRTWTFIGQITGDDWMFSYGGGTDFAPTEPEQWAPAIFNLPSAAKTENVRFKIEFVANSYSNNIYIDDFNFSTWVMGVDETAVAGEMTVWPNPATEGRQIQITYSMPMAGEVNLRLTDLNGAEVAAFPQGNLAAGGHTFNIDLSQLQLQAGCYFISIESESRQLNRKLIVF